MHPHPDFSRRSFLASAGAVGAAAALGALSPASARAATTGTTASATVLSPQTNLSNLVDMRFGMFNHFNMGTFTDQEWASPNQDPKLFAPTSVDCAQWAAAAASAKMSYGVLTTKHHDGFCLWPSKYNKYNVAYSSYTQDIVAQYVTAYRAAGLKVGLYYSIWDRTHPVQAYGGHVTDTTQAIQPANITYILNQITELLTNYGTIDVWVNDGYAWQMGQQAVPYQQIRDLVKSLQPNIVMIDHGGLSVPWLGDAIYFEEPLGITSPPGNTYASVQGNTITSAGWFWHPQDPTTDPMSTSTIVSHLTDLEPKWTSFLLNCPPNRNGVLDPNIVQRLADVGSAWSQNNSRPPLPTQQVRCQYPITPVSAYATGYHTGEGPLRAIDGYSDKDAETCWSTWPGTGSLAFPQSITIDLGGVWNNVTTLEYLPKQWNRTNVTDGDITSFTVWTSTDGITFGQVASGSWAGDHTTKIIEWPAVTAGFVRLVPTAGTGGYANISELRIGGRLAQPALVSQLSFVGKTVHLVNRNSGLVAGVSGSGTANNTPVVQMVKGTATSQLWTIEKVDSGYFRLRDNNSGKLLEIGGLSRSDDATSDIWSDANAPQQHWAITPLDGTYYMLTNRFSGLALNVTGASTTVGSAVTQYSYTGAPQEQWSLA